MAKLCMYSNATSGQITDAIEIIIEAIPILKSVFIKRNPKINMLSVYPIK